MKKLLLAVCLSMMLCFAPLSQAGKPPKGFDGKVYQSVVALYASSPSNDIKDRFICTAEVVKKVDGGYIVLSAGHCTPANSELPKAMTFKVSDDLGKPLHDVYLLKAVLTGIDNPGLYIDYALFYYPTSQKYPVLQLGDENDVRVGDKTIDVDFSMGVAKQTTFGRVNTTVSTIDGNGGVFLVEQFTAGGASGSVVVDERTHKIIGIDVASWNGSLMPAIVESINQVKDNINYIQIKPLKDLQRENES